MTVSLGDILAAIDVVSQLVDECDSMDVEVALAMREAVGQLQSEVKRADAMLATQAKSLLEGGGRQVGDRMYGVKKTGKTRYEHDKVAARVASLATVDVETGEIRSPQQAARTAADMMLDLYVAPSDKPGMVALAKLGIAKGEVSRWEATGSEIVVTDLGTPEDEG